MAFSWKNLFVGGMGQAPDPNNATYSDGGYLRDASQQGFEQAGGRQAPQAANTQVGNVRTANAATIATGPQGQFRTAQQGLLQQLGGVASGQQAGAGEMAVNRQVGQGVAAQQALARSVRGGSAGLAQRGAARNASSLAVDGAGAAQQAALQDQTAARGLMAQLASDGRAQDIGLATSQAGMQQQANLANMDAQNQRIFQQAGLDQATSLANMQARLQQTGMNDQAALAYLGQLYGMNQAEMLARLQQEQASMGQTGILGSTMQAAGPIIAAAAGASDERLKTDVTDGAEAVDEMLAAMRPMVYRYKDEKHGEGRRVGIMAQHLEQSELGRGVVFEDAEGKKVDVVKALSLSLAANARLAARIDQLERQLWERFGGLG